MQIMPEEMIKHVVINPDEWNFYQRRHDKIEKQKLLQKLIKKAKQA